MPISGGIAPALPPVLFVPSSKFGLFPLQIVNATTQAVPSSVLDFSGYNTLSVFITIANLPAGNNLDVTLVTFDPETGAALVGSLGNAVVIDNIAANGSAAATLYLPAYYADLAALVLPFYQHKVNLVHNGGTAGTLDVTAFKLWLSIA